MDVNAFWQIMEHTKDVFYNEIRLGKDDRREKVIEEELNKLSPDDIISFQNNLEAGILDLYSWNMIGASHLISRKYEKDEQEAQLIALSCGVLSLGKDFAGKIVKNADDLNDLGMELRFLDNHELPLIALEVYKNKAKKEMPETTGPELPDKPKGEVFDIQNKEELKKRYPRLWASFGYRFEIWD